MQALQQLQLAKGTSQDKEMSSSEEIKPVAPGVIELCLSEKKSVASFCTILKAFVDLFLPYQGVMKLYIIRLIF